METIIEEIEQTISDTFNSKLQFPKAVKVL